jgi:hypothetical protein
MRWECRTPELTLAHSYIVRIYRRRNEPEVTGMVEFPELDTGRPFHSF